MYFGRGLFKTGVLFAVRKPEETPEGCAREVKLWWKLGTIESL